MGAIPKVLLGFLLVALLAGCGAGGSQATPTPVEGVTVEAVRFSNPDGTELAATLYRPAGAESGLAVVLAHMRPTDQSSWASVAQELATHGAAALTLDFRGYGQSGGERHYGALDQDVSAALAYLSEAGYGPLACVGASMGGTACVKAAQGADLAGLAVISSPLEMEPPLILSETDFAGLSMPKLFVASQADQPYVNDVRQMADWSPEPKQVEIFSGNAHGTYLLDGDHAPEFTGLIVDFIASLSAAPD